MTAAKEQTDELSEVWPVTDNGLELAVDEYISGDLVIDEKSIAAMHVPSVSDRRAEVDLPEPVSSDDILNHDITWLGWRSQSALLPTPKVNTETGEVQTMTNGFLCIGFDHTTKRKVVLFVGGIALVREFARLKAPVRARIEKRGRTLVLR